MAHRCRTLNSSTNELNQFKDKLGEWRTIPTSPNTEVNSDPNEPPILFVPIVYHVLYRVNYENLKLDVLNAQHRSLNADFLGSNPDRERVTDRGPYAFAKLRGCPSLSFTPSLITEKDVRRIQIDSRQPPFRSLRDTLAFGGSQPVIGSINVYIAPLENVLGEALRESFVCVVDTRVVGSRDAPAAVAGYGLGRTLTHEIAHCLSLQHPFGWPKAGPWPHEDIPPQQHPNYIARFVREDDGAWSATKDNFDLDAKKVILIDPVTDQPIAGPYSFGQGHELFCNFMDLGPDDSLVMFTRQQAEQLRLYLVHSGKFNWSTTRPLAANAADAEPGTTVDLSLPPNPDELSRRPAHRPRTTLRGYARAAREMLRMITPSAPDFSTINVMLAMALALLLVVLISFVRRLAVRRPRRPAKH